MWILENETAFDGCKLWLRPGKSYLFGRTASEPGQLAISHSTISRKHLTISVDAVQDGDALHVTRRSKVTIEDLGTKLGTTVSGQSIKGAKHVLEGEVADLTLGKCPSQFRISWLPIGFTFSFTSKELRAKPYDTLRARFEQLDIKLLPDYSQQWTTHVVSKKRNTAKGLQALINAKHIVSETFLDSIAQVAESAGESPSLLEQDFTSHWPDPIRHLPPKGGEPVEHQDSIYTPDLTRHNIFDGYTFVFYDKIQYDNLLAPITNGGGKALMQSIVPNSTTTDDFVGYVKNVAGEKGLGSFDDGSEGKGVVLVRYLPSKGDLVPWYKDFITEVSLRLDHRPIEQSEFLEAILIRDATILRRPLEVESSNNTQEAQGDQIQQDEQNRSDAAVEETVAQQAGNPDKAGTRGSRTLSRSNRAREPAKRRFAGFGDEEDISMVQAEPASAPAAVHAVEGTEEGGLFVSQEPSQLEQQDTSHATGNSQRKRGAESLSTNDLMDGLAPSAERLKRQRIARGEDPVPNPEAPPEIPVAPQQKKKIKKELDVLAVAARNREAEDARARQEQEDLATIPDDVDLAEIRRLNIVEDMPMRSHNVLRTRDQDIADGRWNPRWNGLKNFKQFIPKGQQRGRAHARTIVPLVEVKIKEFGVGDDYWLEDDKGRRQKQQSTIQPSVTEEPPSLLSRGRAATTTVSDESDSDLDSVNNIVERVGRAETRGHSPLMRGSRANASSQGARHGGQITGKRTAASNLTEQSAKRQRPATRATMEIADSDDSGDELKFRFGQRRR